MCGHNVEFLNVLKLVVHYLLTPWSRVLLEKQTVNFAASQEIPRIYGTRESSSPYTRVPASCGTYSK
jgi:hypothetical protein